VTNGETMPNKTLGTAKRHSAESIELAYKFCMPNDSDERSGLAVNAVSAIYAEAAQMIFARSVTAGFLSAILPPIQYPIARLAIIIPINAVHTTRDVPKYGANIREPVISIVMIHIPLRKETRQSLKLPVRSI
jgi:hypothetical protein